MESSEEPKKKIRKRMKGLCQQIQKQMEFYFSDANLYKDRFLKKLMDESPDGFVELETFKKFNKIQALTMDVAVLSKALSGSALLDVSEDGTKVKRKQPLGERKNVDNRTVYVECLPSKVDHEWVRKTFAACGTVEYVSLPKFQSTGDIKGFGFVEFSTEEEAQKACQVLNNPPASVADQLPGKFPKGGKDVQRLQRQLQSHTVEAEKNQPKDDKLPEGKAGSEGTVGTSPGKKARKRKRTPSVSSDTPAVDPQTKRKAGADVTNMSAVAEPNTTPDESHGKKQPSAKRKLKVEGPVSTSAEHSDDHEKKIINATESPLSSPVKRKKTASSVGDIPSPHQRKKTGDDSQVDGSSPAKRPCDLGVVEATPGEAGSTASEGKAVTPSCMKKRKAGTKSEEETREAKKVRISVTVEVREHEKVKKRRKKRNKAEKNKEKSSEGVPELRVIPKKQWVELKKEYIALQKSSMKTMKASLHDMKQKEQERMQSSMKKPGRVLSYTPAVIVKVNSEESMTRKLVKELLSPHGEIIYVDLKDGENVAHLRCNSCDSATSISQAAAHGLAFSVLAGEEEKTYWDKILADQEAKLSRKNKDNKKRGKDKLIERAEKTTLDAITTKHVVFDD